MTHDGVNGLNSGRTLMKNVLGAAMAAVLMSAIATLAPAQELNFTALATRDISKDPKLYHQVVWGFVSARKSQEAADAGADTLCSLQANDGKPCDVILQQQGGYVAVGFCLQPPPPGVSVSTFRVIFITTGVHDSDAKQAEAIALKGLDACAAPPLQREVGLIDARKRGWMIPPPHRTLRKKAAATIPMPVQKPRPA